MMLGSTLFLVCFICPGGTYSLPIPFLGDGKLSCLEGMNGAEGI